MSVNSLKESSTHTLLRSCLLLERMRYRRKRGQRPDKKRAFKGGMYNRHQRRDILQRGRGQSTIANKARGFGRPHHGRKIRMVPRAGGELLSGDKAPPAIEKMRRKSPYRKAARRLAADINLLRTTLLLDHYKHH